MKLILGSGSPRRLELLAQIGVVPDEVRPPDIDETPVKQELPRPYCARMAREKVAAVRADAQDIVLCADTTVALGRRIMGKPEDAAEAQEFLRRLSGRRHKVITALAVKCGEKIWEKDVQSTVRMKNLAEEEIRAYLGTNDWQGKAGGLWHPRASGRIDPLDQRIFHRDRGSALGGNRQSVARCWISAFWRWRADMKGRTILLDHLGEVEAAALMVDGKLDDLLIDSAAPRVGTVYRAIADRPVKGQGGMFLKTRTARPICARSRGCHRERAFLCRSADLPNRVRRSRSHRNCCSKAAMSS